jgi:hypothetical protein
MVTRSNPGWILASAFFAVQILSPVLAAAETAVRPEAKDANVILLTLDGVRWEEVFRGVDDGLSVDANKSIFTYLTETLIKQGVLYGDRTKGESVRVANSAQNSLPGYQSIMAGATQPCSGNGCGRIKVETFPERIVRDLQLSPEQVATVASWERIAYAVEHVERTTFVNAGDRPLLVGNEPLSPDEAKLNDTQTKDSPPWHDARYDKYTFAHAMSYLKAKRPRFLFISLNDSDEWGHKGDYDQYVKTLRQHDEWIKELVTTLDGMDQYGRNTTLIITTDHGRGEGNGWDDHGAGIADSGNVWIYGRSPYTEFSKHAESAKPKKRAPSTPATYTHLDIRPTIEATFGLKPKLDGVNPPPGQVITSIVGNPAPARLGRWRPNQGAKAFTAGRPKTGSTSRATQ